MAEENALELAATEEVTERHLSNSQKCAILMLLLGEEEASEVLRRLSPMEVQHLGAAMFSVANVDQTTVNRVLDEFINIIRGETSLGLASGEYIRNVMARALGEDRATSVLSRITPSTSSKGIDLLQWMDSRSIAEMIVTEHPQVVALVLSYLDYSVAADVLSMLPAQVQPEVIKRIATLDMVSPEAVKELENIMQTQFSTNASLRASSIGGIKVAAKIMNFTKQDLEQRVVKQLFKEDKTLITNIQDNMFTFENLIMVDEKSLGVLLRNVETDLLVTAVKGADDRLKEKIFGCMSSRAAANILDELEAKGPMRVTDVQEAQKQVIAIARKLSDAGSMMLAGRGDDFV
jgi:flagellar motor switch protein FliG